MSNPSTAGMASRLLIRQQFVAYLTAELVRARPHVSVREMMPALERAGELYLQLANRRVHLEHPATMQAMGYQLARVLTEGSEKHSIGVVDENPVSVVERSFAAVNSRNHIQDHLKRRSRGFVSSAGGD